jgi:hypothetical protein
MKTKGRGWIRNAGSLAVIVLVLTMGLGPAFAEERAHGKDLSVQKTDGQVIKGELIAVRTDSLLIDSLDPSENAIDIRDVSLIIIINKSRFWSGLGVGLVIGAGGGALIGLASGDDRTGWFRFTAGEKATVLGIALGVIGGTLGGIEGALAGADENIRITEPRDPKDIAKLLDRLRSVSRFPDEK